MRDVILAAVLLLAQRALGAPGMPGWWDRIWLPAVWLAVRALRGRPLSPWGGLALGAGWDLLLEPVVGPGAIAWSAAAATLRAAARIVSTRAVPVWPAAGLAAVLVVDAVRRSALAPLGISPSGSWGSALSTGLVCGLLCGAVRAVELLDPVGRWRRARARRLR